MCHYKTAGWGEGGRFTGRPERRRRMQRALLAYCSCNCEMAQKPGESCTWTQWVVSMYYIFIVIMYGNCNFQSKWHFFNPNSFLFKINNSERRGVNNFIRSLLVTMGMNADKWFTMFLRKRTYLALYDLWFRYLSAHIVNGFAWK